MLFSARKDSLTLIIDLQSSIVRGSLVWIRPGIPPHILFTYNKGIPYRPRAGSAYLIKVALHNISETIDAVMRYISIESAENGSLIPHRIDEVHYVLSSPWVVSQAKTVSSTFPRPVELSEARLREILSEERSRLTAGELADTAIVEEKVFDVRLNGYSVADWHGQLTTELAVSYVVSGAGKRMIERLKDACGHIVRDSHIFFHSSLLLQYVGIRDLMPETGSYTLVHVHGELTDIVVVEKNACIFFGSFPMGIYTIIRKIAHAMKTDTHAADSLLTLYVSHHLDSLPERNVIPVMNDMAEGWISEFGKLLKASGMNVTVSKRIIISGRAHEDFFSASMKHAHPDTDIRSLEMDDFGILTTFGNGAERKPLLGLYALAIHSMGKLD